MPRFAVFLLLACFALGAHAQSVRVEPEALTLKIGETATLTAEAVGADGAVLEAPILFFSRSRRNVSVDRQSGLVTALKPGSYRIVALAAVDGQRILGEMDVTVLWPPVETVAFAGMPAQAYQGTRLPLATTVTDASGAVRDNVAVRFESSDPSVAAVDPFGNLHAHRTGTVTLTAQAEDARATHTLRVAANPVAQLDLRSTAETARTGDVLTFTATATDGAGNTVSDVPVHFAFQAMPSDNLGPSATGQITQEGRFVAEAPGHYTITATTGSHTAQHTVAITQRDVTQEIELTGQGLVSDVHTSDLWVWEAADGRDYAITGTWGGNGEARFWDVTDPANPIPVDTVTVDARTVNDVKVSEDGTVCVISREGASDRKNGFVILDCTDPTNVSIHAAYDDEMTGGVHNVFIYQNHVYAVNNGRRYDIINIADPKNPYRVGRFELETEGHAIHDVWVEDGIAYSSNWTDGVVMVDVGNGIAGGSVSNPVEIGRYAYPSGWNHAAFPYKDEETGKFYIIAGDEAFVNGLNTEDRPTIPAGWIHFIDFTDPLNPKEVARYEVPEAGTHNFWVEDDKLYIAYYNAGLRVVDISGDLMGDLYQQGREIARYLTHDPNGYIPNAPMAWGPQPHKGHVFLSDWNSGIWVVKLKPRPEEERQGL